MNIPSNGFFPTKDTPLLPPSEVIIFGDGPNNRNRDTTAWFSTAATAMRLWVSEPQCSYENHNRNRGYFFNNRSYYKKFLFKKEFILPMLKFELLLCHRNLLLFCNRASTGIYGLILFLKFVKLKFKYRIG